jgi:hypothetical protein
MKKENSIMKGLYKKLLILLRIKRTNELSEDNITSNIEDNKKNIKRRPEAAREL